MLNSRCQHYKQSPSVTTGIHPSVIYICISLVYKISICYNLFLCTVFYHDTVVHYLFTWLWLNCVVQACIIYNGAVKFWKCQCHLVWSYWEQRPFWKVRLQDATRGKLKSW